MRRLALIIALGLVLAACSSASDVSPEEATLSDGVATNQAMLAVTGDAAEGGAAEGEAPALDVRFDVIDDRKVIRQASIHVHAEDTRALFDEIVALTESVGGFVAQANVLPTTGEEDQPDISVTVRIPADELTSTMAAIRDAADEVVTESQGAQDVTEQFVDLEARLRNLEALEVELRALLEDVRQQEGADPQKLLTVFNELANVRGQIEQVQGQINVLSDRTALATLEVQVTQTPAAVPIVETPWAPGEVAREALRNLVVALQGIADWGINFALYTLPVLLLTLTLPAVAGTWAYRRFRNRQGPGGPAAPSPAET